VAATKLGRCSSRPKYDRPLLIVRKVVATDSPSASDIGSKKSDREAASAAGPMGRSTGTPPSGPRRYPGWLDFYNWRRPHGSLSHKPPGARLAELNNLAGASSSALDPPELIAGESPTLGRTLARISEASSDSALAGAEPIFYFDFSSPFAYLAATRIDDVLPRMPRWAPISMAFITSAHKRIPWSMREESKEPGKRER
jgi:hypothetical protein